MPNISLEFHYPLFTFLIFALVLVFVPKPKLAPFFWASLVWGFFVSVLFQSCATSLNLFHFIKAYPFTFLGSPIWLNVAWLGSIMLYLRFLPTRKLWYVFPMYLLIFAFTSTLLDMLFHQLGLLIYTSWNPYYRFLVSLGWFYGAAKHQQILDKALIKDEAAETI